MNQNLTDTDSTSLFFEFICDLQCNVKEDEARNIIFEVMLKSTIFDRLDLSEEFFEQFDCCNKDLKKQVGLFEIESIDKPNIISIALNPKENSSIIQIIKNIKVLKMQRLTWILILILLAYQILLNITVIW